MSLILGLLTSRAGLLAMAFFGIIVFYEGLPIGPLRLVPVLGPVQEIVTDGRVDRERKKALEGFVHIAELEAEKAKSAEAERQRNVAQDEIEKLRLVEEAEDAKDRLQMDRLEQEIADNEKLLSARGRSCLLDDSDLDFLLKP